MEFVVKNQHCKHLIVLVHGLNGSRDTWIGSKQKMVENLKDENLIKENFDVAIYNYGTKIFQINWLARILSLIFGFLNNKPKEKKIARFNVGIEKLSLPLVAQVNTIKDDYETISFIAHSMGGLVTKSALTLLSDDSRKKIHLFVSLSVPHLGAQLANLGSKLFGKNPQIVDLKTFGKFVTRLNRNYAQIKIRPKIVYQFGIQDNVVPELSAAPEIVPFTFIEATSDDHFSVLLIQNKQNNFLFKRILKELTISISEFIGIDVGIPKGLTFKSFLETILVSEKFQGITVKFLNFKNDDLNSLLREGNLTADNFTEFLIKLRTFSIYNLPEYIVTKEKGTLNYVIKAIYNE